MTTSQATQNKISDLNYYNGALTEGSSFTGTWEPCLHYNCMSVILKSTDVDKLGRLQIQFSRDGSTPIKSTQLRVMDEQLNKVIFSSIKSLWVRVVFLSCNVIDSRTTTINNNYANVEIQTMFHDYALESYDIDISKQKYFHKFYDFGSAQFNKIAGYLNGNFTQFTFPLPTSGQLIRINNNVTGNGEATTGLRTVLITGVNADFEEIYWKAPITISTTNSGNTTSPTAIWLGVNEIIPLTYGSLGRLADSSVITVSINDGTYKTVQVLSSQIFSHPSSSFYTLPRGYQCCKVISSKLTSTDAGNSGQIGLLKRVKGSTTRNRNLQHLGMSNPTFHTLKHFDVYNDGCEFMSEGDGICCISTVQTNSYVMGVIELELS